MFQYIAQHEKHKMTQNFNQHENDHLVDGKNAKTLYNCFRAEQPIFSILYNGAPPPPKWKKCYRKLVLFTKALFLATKFPKS